MSQNTALVSLSCGQNQLTALDVSQNTALTELFCNENQLTALDVSQHTALTDLECSNNQLTALDVSQDTALEILSCEQNQLTSLDLSSNTNLRVLYAEDNRLNVVLDGNDAFDLSSLPNFDIDRVLVWHGAVLNGNMLTFTQQEVTYLYATAYAGENEDLPSVWFTLVADRDPSVGNEAIEDQPQGRVYAKDRTIFTEGISGEVSVFTNGGTLIYKGYATEIPVPASGVYIVNYGGRSCKVFIL